LISVKSVPEFTNFSHMICAELRFLKSLFTNLDEIQNHLSSFFIDISFFFKFIFFQNVLNQYLNFHSLFSDSFNIDEFRISIIFIVPPNLSAFFITSSLFNHSNIKKSIAK